MGMTGTIPPSGWVLPSRLQKLEVAGTVWHSGLLRGSFPTRWPGLPATLQHLDLSRNYIGGNIHSLADWSLPEYLLVLNLSHNSLKGSWPAGWALPPHLEVLKLHANALTGSLPLLLPSSLYELWLGDNAGLTGSLPSTLQGLPRLRTLYLANCQFSGGFPPGWALPPRLELLSLRGNRIQNTLPFPFSLPEGLQSLLLGGNKLSGPLSRLVLPESLADLDLENNALTGAALQYAHKVKHPT
jgi:hypothetical protein